MNAERIENLPKAKEGAEEAVEFSYHCAYSAFLRTTLAMDAAKYFSPKG